MIAVTRVTATVRALTMITALACLLAAIGEGCVLRRGVHLSVRICRSDWAEVLASQKPWMAEC